MRTAPRDYLVGEDGQIHRLAQKTFLRILAQKKATPFPELKGHRVRLATLHVQLGGNRPVAIAKASDNFITFDDDGLIVRSRDSPVFRLITSVTSAASSRRSALAFIAYPSSHHSSSTPLLPLPAGAKLVLRSIEAVLQLMKKAERTRS